MELYPLYQIELEVVACNTLGKVLTAVLTTPVQHDWTSSETLVPIHYHYVIIVTVKFLWIKLLCTFRLLYTAGIWIIL
jgi:hypothetical protein